MRDRCLGRDRDDGGNGDDQPRIRQTADDPTIRPRRADALGHSGYLSADRGDGVMLSHAGIIGASGVAAGYTNLLTNPEWSGAASGTPGTAPTSWNLLDVQPATTTVNGSSVTFSSTSARVFYAQGFSVVAGDVFRVGCTLEANTGCQIRQIINILGHPIGSVLTWYRNGSSVANTTVPSAGDSIYLELTDITIDDSSVFFYIGAGATSTTNGSCTLSAAYLYKLA